MQWLNENSLSSQRSDLSQRSGIQMVLIIGKVWMKGFADGAAAMLPFSGVDEMLCDGLYLGRTDYGGNLALEVALSYC